MIIYLLMKLTFDILFSLNLYFYINVHCTISRWFHFKYFERVVFIYILRWPFCIPMSNWHCYYHWPWIYHSIRLWAYMSSVSSFSCSSQVSPISLHEYAIENIGCMCCVEHLLINVNNYHKLWISAFGRELNWISLFICFFWRNFIVKKHLFIICLHLLTIWHFKLMLLFVLFVEFVANLA